MLRVLAGIVVGLGYGVLVGGIMLLILSGEPPGVLLLDYNKISRVLTLLAMITTGSVGALVGSMVTLLRVRKIKAGMIGFCIGLVVIAGVFFTMRMYADVPWSDRGGLFLMFI